MVKVRKGSQRGQTKFTKAGRRRARRQSHSSSSRFHAVVHDEVRPYWDPTLTRLENYKKIGLRTRVNDDGAPRSASPSQAVAQMEKIANKPTAKAAPRVCNMELDLLHNLVEKHGDDWDAMAKDIKINYLQYTAAQLRRKAARASQLLEAQNSS